MLVLQRDLGKPIRIRVGNTEIWVMIGRTEKGMTQLLIEAPKEVEIVRDELLPDNEQMASHPNAHRFRHLLTGPIFGRAAMPSRHDKPTKE